RDFDDKSLAPYAGKLSEMNIPVTESSARMMREILAMHPNLSPEEAAFLASNKITGDIDLMRSALELLAGGEKTDAMIDKLLSSLGELGNNPENLDAGENTTNTVNSTPLTELLTVLVKNAPAILQATNGENVQPSQITQTIITHPDDNMQSNVKNDEVFFQNNQTASQNVTPEQGENTATQQVGTNLPTSAGVTQGDGSVVQSAEQVQVTNHPSPLGGLYPHFTKEGEVHHSTIQDTPTQTAQTSAEPALEGTHKSASPTDAPSQPTMGNAVASLLSEIPEFKGTPTNALERFSEMLLKVAGDTDIVKEVTEGIKETDSLAAQLDKLFTRIGREDTDAGMKLRAAREELFARLSLIEEAISRSTGPARTELLAQTQKLMDHVRVLNNIDQFVYMQLPVQLREERKSAELYVFKKKGSRRTDPDNVNILLAIDLEFMGHWEALLNIKGKDVSINMEVLGDAEKEHFAASTVVLHEMLSEEGFKLVGTSIKVSEEKTTPLTALSAFDRYTGGKIGRIDFKI
ncbi:MAG: hypothetical protein LBC73_05125, partial [Oscillospiraceae bacterium]|nr:hypothetical protein [Oscillospiraceae bacterium]